MKFIIYNSDMYYPYAEEYDSLEVAIRAFEKLKKERYKEYDAVEKSKPINGKHCHYCDKDYLCVVLDECDIKEYGIK